MLRAKELNSEIFEYLFTKGFLKNGKNLNFLLCLDDFPFRNLYFRIEI